MTRYFTHYWTNQTWENAQTDQDFTVIDCLGSNLFRKRRAAPGDQVYVVTVLTGQLYLLGKLVIGAVGDATTIAPLLGTTPDQLWEADDHIAASAATPPDFERCVPRGVTEQVQCQSSTGTKGLTFKTPGALDGQTLRGVRELTAQSAALLDTLLPALQSTAYAPRTPHPNTAQNDQEVPVDDDALMDEPPSADEGGIRPDLHAYHQSINNELTSVRNRIRYLIGKAHWLTDGEHKEAIVRRVLRSHVPEIIRVGRGFVCYRGGTSSNQIDILLTDTRQPTLFKDDELVIVTADAVRAIIEVKTKQSTTQLRETLTKLGDNVAAIRESNPETRCLAGLFVHDDDGLTGPNVLRALHKAADKHRNRAIDFVAVGNAIFTQYSEFALSGKGGDAPLWYLYSIDRLAPAYFISHIAWRVTEHRSHTMRWAWFPLQDTIRNKTPAWISLQTNRIHTTDLSFVP